MTVLFGVFLLTLLVITAVAIVRTQNLFVAVMLLGIFSLLIAANFFILDAADVALTEAAVGAGISTVLFLGALALTSEHERAVTPHRWLSLLVVSSATLVVMYATFDKPTFGDASAPVHQHVAPWYLEKTPELIGIPNVVTAVLGSFRGYDTLGEVFVVFTAGIGVLFLLSAPRRTGARDQLAQRDDSAIGLREKDSRYCLSMSKAFDTGMSVGETAYQWYKLAIDSVSNQDDSAMLQVATAHNGRLPES